MLPKSSLLSLIAIICSALHTHAQVWAPLGPIGFSAGNALIQSIAVNRHNTTYVCFQDGTVNYSPSVMKYDGSWQLVDGPGLSGGPVSPLSNAAMALDTAGNPCIAFGDGYFVPSHALTVMRYNGTSWDTLGPRAFSNPAPVNISIAVDKHNTPYVAFRDYVHELSVTVMRYDGVGWTAVGSEGFSGRAFYISLALDTGGTPYVAYSDIGNGERASVMKYDGSDWVYVGNAGLSDSTAWYTQIMIGSDNTPYLTYCDIARDQKATTVKYNGSSWVPVGVPGFSRAEAWNIATAIGTNDTPMVCYQDGSADLRITVMKYNGTSWQNAGNDRFTPYQAGVTFLAVDNNNIPLVAYTDPTTPLYQCTVRKLGSTFAAAVNTCEQQSPFFSVYPNPAHDMLFVNLTTVQKEDMQVSVQDVMGNTVHIFHARNGITAHNIAMLPPGTYFITAAAKQNRQSAKIVIE